MLANTATLRWSRFSKYVYVLSTSLKNSRVYPVEMLLPAILVAARLWVFALLFQAAFSSLGVTAVNDFTVAMSIWTVMVSISLQQASKARIWREISQDVQSGAFAILINKPVLYGGYHFMRYVGSIIPGLAFSLVVGIAICLAIAGPIAVSPWHLLAALPTFVIGLCINFLLWFCVGLCALWLEDATPLTWIVGKMVVIFGGLVIPIALLPSAVGNIAELLPFAMLFALPSQLIFNFSGDAWAQLIITQLAWALFFSLFSAWLFAKGRRHVASNGG